MIKPTNNISFKALIIPEDSSLTDSQERVTVGIRKELGDMEKNGHFLVKPLEDDIVELSQIIKVKDERNGNVVWNKDDLLYIGEYSEKHPFKSKDYLKAIAQPYKDLLMLIGITVTGALIMIGGALAHIGIRENSTQQVEKVVTTIAKDSLKIIK